VPALLRKVTITRFRCIASLEWSPTEGLNVLVGPPDSGKSTILSAIALLLAPSVVSPRTEFDYRNRDVAQGFCIEALIGGIDPDIFAAERRVLPFFGLTSDGTLIGLPEPPAEPVLRVRVSGNADLEAEHEILAPTGDPIAFGIGLRKRLGLVQFSDDSSSARALRISPNSVLGKQFNPADLRGSVQEALASLANELPLSADTKGRIKAIQTSFEQDGLPSDVELGLASPQGADLLSLVDLVRGNDLKTAIPLALSGSGTRSLISLSLLTRGLVADAIVLFQEPERGLDPYRQRIAAKKLDTLRQRRQLFVTTHSPTMLQALAEGTVWRIDRGGSASFLKGEAVRNLMKADPEALFAPLPLICEGPTECGLSDVLLPHLLGQSLESLGIHVVNGGGNEVALRLAEALSNAGMTVAVLVDNEDDRGGLRERVATKAPMFSWPDVKNIEEYVSKYVPLTSLPRVLDASKTEQPYRFTQLRDALPDTKPKTELTWQALSSAHEENVFRVILYNVMSKNSWFKRRDSGAALASALIEVGLPGPIVEQLKPFIARLKK